MDLIEYQKINNAFRRKLVFHLGADAGFFSEFNNMVLAMLYCLQHEIRFVLYSDKANFKISKGWEDFFVPFCEETRQRKHRRFNKRYPLEQMSPAKRLRTFLFKKMNGIDFLTYDLWFEFRNRSLTSQPHSFSSYHNLDLQSAARILISMIWNYNAKTHDEIEAIKNAVSLPEKYLGIHVRAGDKRKEIVLADISYYMRKAESLSPLRDVFLATDDYSIYEEARHRYREYSFVTLSTPSERGYVHKDFMRQGRSSRAAQLLMLFATVDLLARAEYFIGTFTSNIGMYLGMRMDKDRVFAVDRASWDIW